MDISLFRAVASQYQSLRQLNTVSTMTLIRHEIEEQIIRHRLPVDFYAGFQHFSQFPEYLHRYSHLGTICRRVYVFGVADYHLPHIPGIEFIEIRPTSALALECFVLVNTPDFWTTLISKEVDGKDAITGGRRFDGIWSFDDQVVERVALLMSQVMEVAYEPTSRRNYVSQNSHISEMSGHILQSVKRSEMTANQRWQQLSMLHKMANVQGSDPLALLQDAARILESSFGAKGVAIAFKPGDHHYTVPVALGAAKGRGQKISTQRGLCGRVIRLQRPILVTDSRQEGISELLMPSAQSLIAVPIVASQLYGALLIGHPQSHKWSSEDSQAIITAATMLAIKLEQPLLLQKQHRVPQAVGCSASLALSKAPQEVSRS